MARVHGLTSAALVLLLAFTCVFANRDLQYMLQNAEHIAIRQSSSAPVSVDAIDIMRIIKKLDSVVTEVVNEFDEMMSLEPTAEDEEQIDASSSEAMPQITFEPQLESAIVSSAPTASVAPVPTKTGSSSPRTRSSSAIAMPSTSPHGDALVSSAEIEELEEETTVEETTDEEATVEETTVEETTDEEATGEEATDEETTVEETTVEETAVEETTVEETTTKDEQVEESEAPKNYKPSVATRTPQPPKQSPKPSPSPSVSPSSSPTPSPSPSPKEKPFRTLTFGYKGYTDSIVLLLPDAGENAEDMESFVDQLREEGFTRTKFIVVQPNDIWIRSKGEKQSAWFDASAETIGPIRETQLLHATKKVMKAARGRRPTIIGFGQGGGIALTAYMRYGTDGVVSSCGGLPLLATYPREMTDDSKDSMALVIGGDHVRNGVERMQNAGREVVFLRTNQPKENGRFKDNVIGYVVGVLNRAIAT